MRDQSVSVPMIRTQEAWLLNTSRLVHHVWEVLTKVEGHVDSHYAYAPSGQTFHWSYSRMRVSVKKKMAAGYGQVVIEHFIRIMSLYIHQICSWLSTLTAKIWLFLKVKSPLKEKTHLSGIRRGIWWRFQKRTILKIGRHAGVQSVCEAQRALRHHYLRHNNIYLFILNSWILLRQTLCLCIY